MAKLPLRQQPNYGLGAHRFSVRVSRVAVDSNSATQDDQQVREELPKRKIAHYQDMDLAKVL